MKVIVALCAALVLAGCISANSLQHWTGREDSWLLWKEGPAEVDEVIGTLAPGEPTRSLLLDVIQGAAPTYQGEVRHMQWTTLAYDYHAYLIHTNQRWIVVNAFRGTPAR